MICLKIRTFVVSATTYEKLFQDYLQLWFAWKFVPLWYQQQRAGPTASKSFRCDLLENSYLCGISNNVRHYHFCYQRVVICLKIRTFVVSATTSTNHLTDTSWLWFAWKFVPLWYQQQRNCGHTHIAYRCDLLENSYLCGISNNFLLKFVELNFVVICLKIRTFVVSATTFFIFSITLIKLWFAWKFVPLWYQQQRSIYNVLLIHGCDLLENSYLCGISNNRSWIIYWLA